MYQYNTSTNFFENRLSHFENFLITRSQFNTKNLLFSIGALVSKLENNDVMYRNEILKLTSKVQFLEQKVYSHSNSVNSTIQKSNSITLKNNSISMNSFENCLSLKESKSETDSAINIQNYFSQNNDTLAHEKSTPIIDSPKVSSIAKCKSSRKNEVKMSHSIFIAESDSAISTKCISDVDQVSQNIPYKKPTTPNSLPPFNNSQHNQKESKTETDSAFQVKKTKQREPVHTQICYSKLPLLHGDPLPPTFKPHKKRKHKSKRTREIINTEKYRQGFQLRTSQSFQ